MGAYTADAQVWYPDITDTAKLNTLLATMASSIEEGIGKRLKLQEIAVGFKASVDGWTIPNIASTPNTVTVPVTVTSGLGDFNNGFSFSGGIATVQTAGMYLVTTSLGPKLPDSGSCSSKAEIWKNGALIAGSEVALQSSVWTNSQATAVVNCVPGDTLQLKGGIAGSPNSSHASYGNATYVSIALVQATPS